MGLADIMLGGGGVLFGRHPKVTTPPFQPNRGVQVPPAGGAGPDLAQADSLAVDQNTGLTANQATLRDALAHPPQEGVDPTTGRPISKFRKIMGTVASVAGPMIGGPGVTGLGDKLLHPGMEAWQQKVARANALSNLDMTALQHRDLQQNRADQNTARAAMQTDREQGNIDRVENKGAWQVPLGSLSQKLMYQENAPQTGDPIADLPTQQMNLKGGIATGADVIDPRTGKRAGDVGDVEMMDKPGTQGKDKVAMLRPSQAMLGDFAAEAEGKKRKAALLEARTEEITPQMIADATAIGAKGLPAPGMVTPTVYNNFQTTMRDFGKQSQKPDKAAMENENQWIAISSDPNTPAPEKAIADAKLKRLHDERMATRPVNETAATSLLDRQMTRFTKPHEKSLSDANTQLEKISDARAMINGNAASQALGIPKILTALVSGQGSGVRITQAELNSIAKARGISGDVEGFFNKLSGAGTLTSTQKQQLTQILDDVRERLHQKQAIASEALDTINGAASRDEVIKADKAARQKLMDMEKGATGGGTVHYVVDGTSYDIPADKAAAFTAQHPNAQKGQ